MNTLQTILIILIAVLGYPVGRFIASKTREELESGRKWFIVIISASIIGILISLIMLKGDNLLISVSAFIYMSLIALASIKI